MTENPFMAALAAWVIQMLAACERNSTPHPDGVLQLVSVKVGQVSLSPDDTTTDVPLDAPFIIRFGEALDTAAATGNVILKQPDANPVASSLTFEDGLKTIVVSPLTDLKESVLFSLEIADKLKSAGGASFPGLEFFFMTTAGTMEIRNITLNGKDFSGSVPLQEISYQDIRIEAEFTDTLDPWDFQQYFSLSGSQHTALSLSGDGTRAIMTNQEDLEDFTAHTFVVSSDLKSKDGSAFGGFSNRFYTRLDTTPKFPPISDEDLLDLLESQTFKYFYDFAHPDCGLARERNTSGDIVTTGGSGFGIMSLIAGMKRGYITRDQGLQRIDKILGFLESCDRFHGAWPHWLNGSTGKVHPFSQKDDGADLVETAFMIQGLLAFRQYLDPEITAENDLIGRINLLWQGVEWDWFTRGGEDVLYWHWSPNYEWDMNLPVRGYNEALIVYVLAASSPTHPIEAEVFHSGYMRNGGVINGNSYYGYTLPLGSAYGGPLFFAHYSFLGLDPRNLTDSYADYWEQNVNHSLINRAYCQDNPGNYVGYSGTCWGLTASDDPDGYSAHSPTNDLGVITPTAALSSLPYTPEYSMDALRHFYYRLGDRLWGEYGFHDAFDVTRGWWADSYIAIDQGPIVVMTENYRSGLLWDLFMSCPEISGGLDKLGFSY